MNIFFLDKDPNLAAQYHNDKHVVKMILETAQLISTCQRICMENCPDSYYKITHKNHPCSIWLRETNENFYWLLELGVALIDEYKFRFDKHHKSSRIIEQAIYDGSWVRNWRWRNYRDKIGEENEQIYPAGMYLIEYKDIYTITDPALAMPDKYKTDDPIESYRNYYKEEKRLMSNGKSMDIWTKRGKPPWWI